MAERQSEEAYELDPAFERAAVTLACCRPKFYARTAHALNPALLNLPEAKLAIEAARQIFLEAKRGPDSLLVVIQRLMRWKHEGKITKEQIAKVSDLFDTAEDKGLPEELSIEGELIPVLKRRIEKQATQAAIDAYGKKGNFENVIDLVARRNRLGQNSEDLGTKIGSATFKAIEDLKRLVRVPIGILELDTFLGGGIPRGEQLVWIGGPGAGKSMAMSHSGSHSMKMGMFVAYATLEVPATMVAARVKSNLTSIPINSILEDDAMRKKCRERLEQMTGLGPFIVRDFTPHATTLEDLTDWVKNCEDDVGAKCDKLIVDYADKLTVPSAKEKESKSEYHSMRLVYEGLRVYGLEHNMVTETASQSQGRAEKKAKKVDLEHTADSMHKVRCADLVITLNYDEEEKEMGFFVAKNRTGESRRMIGPFMTNFACGAVAPVLPWAPLTPAHVQDAYENIAVMDTERALKQMEDANCPF